jgi:hypothetical protein
MQTLGNLLFKADGMTETVVNGSSFFFSRVWFLSEAPVYSDMSGITVVAKRLGGGGLARS